MNLYSISLDLYKLAVTQDASGATIRTSGATTATGLLCSVQPLLAYERDLFMRRDIVADYQIFTDYDFDTNISGGLKVGYKFKDPATGFEYHVKGVEPSKNSIIRSTPLYRVLALRVIV